MVEDTNQTDNDESIPAAVVRGAASGLEVAGSLLLKQARSWLRWLGAGSAGGAVVLGGVGVYHFGLNGLAPGAGVGAVLGALLIVILYVLAATA